MARLAFVSQKQEDLFNDLLARNTLTVKALQAQFPEHDASALIGEMVFIDECRRQEITLEQATAMFPQAKSTIEMGERLSNQRSQRWAEHQKDLDPTANQLDLVRDLKAVAATKGEVTLVEDANLLLRNRVIDLKSPTGFRPVNQRDVSRFIQTCKNIGVWVGKDSNPLDALHQDITDGEEPF